MHAIMMIHAARVEQVADVPLQETVPKVGRAAARSVRVPQARRLTLFRWIQCAPDAGLSTVNGC